MKLTIAEKVEFLQKNMPSQKVLDDYMKAHEPDDVIVNTLLGKGSPEEQTILAALYLTELQRVNDMEKSMAVIKTIVPMMMKMKGGELSLDDMLDHKKENQREDN